MPFGPGMVALLHLGVVAVFHFSLFGMVELVGKLLRVNI
jgi:hypothetical protein